MADVFVSYKKEDAGRVIRLVEALRAEPVQISAGEEQPGHGGVRNAQWTLADRACDCEQTSTAVTVCIADLAYSCVWDRG